MMNRMTFQVISSIFCDFQLERDQPTNRPTDRPTDRASYRGAMAHLKSSLDLDFSVFTLIIGKKREKKGADFMKMEEKV